MEVYRKGGGKEKIVKESSPQPCRDALLPCVPRGERERGREEQDQHELWQHFVEHGAKNSAKDGERLKHEDGVVVDERSVLYRVSLRQVEQVVAESTFENIFIFYVEKETV